MASKSSRKRRRAQKRTTQAKVAVLAVQVAGAGKMATHAPSQSENDPIRPTGERMARGFWRLPQGMGKNEQPAIDTSSDMVGILHDAELITTSQEQAARQWQALRADYLAELPDVAGYKSCIAGNVPGYDDGDGDPVVIAEYRRMEKRLTRPQRLEMMHVCEDGYKPSDIALLRSALDAIGGC